MYNWQLNDWTKFTFNENVVQPYLLEFNKKMGFINGVSVALSKKSLEDTIITLMVEEAVKTSEIENEFVSRIDVLSSIKKKLGYDNSLKQIRDKSAIGLGCLMVEVRKNFNQSLNEDTLFEWHKLLFQHANRIHTGVWRFHKEPMQVVSGNYENEIIHFEAPPSEDVPKMMQDFISWFNTSLENKMYNHPLIRAGISHLYFESIHPFEDGNGRIGRALAEKAILQSTEFPILLSLSTAIEAKKAAYYQALKLAQQRNEVTDWLIYFFKTVNEAIDYSTIWIEFTLNKVKWYAIYGKLLNERQNKVINRMFEQGPTGFISGMSAKKYMSITGTSKATATRDLKALESKGALVQKNAGRNTSYDLSIF